MKNNKRIRDCYEILKEICEGSFYKVYESKEIGTDIKKAIRIREKNDGNQFDEYDDLDFYFNQVYIMKLMNGKGNENINTVKLYEYFDIKDEFAIITELCDCSLLKLIEQRKSLEIDEIYSILLQLNNSFKIMSDYKIIHRNIKPATILIKYDNKEKTKYTVKLSGYSVSYQIYENKMPNTFLGSSYFQAPEIEIGDYNEECDLWSLGNLIYILYFGKIPFKEQEELLESNNSFFDDLIRRLLTKDPTKRITWEEYFNHPFFSKNNINSLDCLNIKQSDSINSLELKNQLVQENENLKKKINALEKEINEEKNKNKMLEGKIEELNKELSDKINKIKNLEKVPGNAFDSKEELYKVILEKDKELKELKLELSRYPIKLKEGEKLMTVNITTPDSSIQNYSIL